MKIINNGFSWFLAGFLLIGISTGAVAGVSQTTIQPVKYSFVLHQPMEEDLTNLELSVGVMAQTESRLQQKTGTLEETQAKQLESLTVLAEKTQDNRDLSQETYEQIIIKRLGEPTAVEEGKNSQIMIFPLAKADFRGYMAKIKLKTPQALRVTLAPKAKPQGETTLEAVQNQGAILGINGGGFATQTVDGVANLVPMGNTMIRGKLVGNFQPATNNFAFAGFTKDGELVGGSYQSKSKLLNSGAWQGVSFVPVLIKDWQICKIPAKWKNSRQPRTVLGQYPNGDIFFIVVDGRQEEWSKGITLEEIQRLLIDLGVMEAFNLDGGGSSTFVYDGVVRNKPSDGKTRKLATNIVVLK